MTNLIDKSEDKETQNTSTIKTAVRYLFGGWYQAYLDIQNGVVQPFSSLESTTKPGIVLFLSVIVTWFLYVPIHELLHVAGCVWTGGSVSELVMGKEYGATFLSQFFPFITPATTKYAGRVTGFVPNGDIGYLITVFAPFILSIFPGVWCLKQVYKKQKYWLMGPGVVIGLASFYNITGDFFEMGTILSTRIVNAVSGGFPGETYPGFWLLRSDDIFRLFTEISASPANYGVGEALGLLVTSAVIVFGAIIGISLASLVYWAGRNLAKLS